MKKKLAALGGGSSESRGSLDPNRVLNLCLCFPAEMTKMSMLCGKPVRDHRVRDRMRVIFRIGNRL